MPTLLYHVSGWQCLTEMEVGSAFILRPGTQNAEGVGVYFSEAVPRLSAAEGARGCPAAIVVLDATESAGWWQSKGAKAKKFGKPTTWHSDGKSICCQVVAMKNTGTVIELQCSWQWSK